MFGLAEKLLKDGSYSVSDNNDLSSVMDVDEVKEIKVIQNRVVSGNGSISSASSSGIVTAVVLLHEPGVIAAGVMGIDSHAGRGWGKFA